MLINVVAIVLGAAALVFAADKLVAFTGDLATRVGVSPVVIGAIVIGFGSSLPEMVVSLFALDQPNGLDLAIGNVVGSNIANISLVLGFGVLFFPFSGQSSVIRREGVLMMGGLLLMSVFLWDQNLVAWEGFVLLAALIATGFVVVGWSRDAPAPTQPSLASSQSGKRLALKAVASLIGLAVAARALVLGAEGVALEVGLDEGLVGLTILALGTSLPELGTVIASARRGRSDLVLGNVLGSNLFNALGVAGLSGVVGAGTLATDFGPDLVVMIALAGLAGAAAWTGDRLNRAEGALMLTAYPASIWLAL